MQQAGEYIRERELLDKKKKGEKYSKDRNLNKNIERKKGNSVPFCVRTASSGKLVITFIYT